MLDTRRRQRLASRSRRSRAVGRVADASTVGKVWRSGKRRAGPLQPHRSDQRRRRAFQRK